MKQLTILSGKGGTGKTSLIAGIAHLASGALEPVLVDADVDAANLELVCRSERREEHIFVGGRVATIDPGSCSACGICEQVCRFDAVLPGAEHFSIVPLECEGCDACVHQCPEKAITSEDQQAGLWFRSDTLFGPLFHAHLFAGGENSGKLVGAVKQEGRSWAESHSVPLVLIDGPPGIGCPVIAACSGVDLALMVAEPTVSAIHDLERVIRTVKHFGVSAAVVVNKSDLNPSRTASIKDYCSAEGIRFLGVLPFDTVVTMAMAKGLPVTLFDGQAEVSLAMVRIWNVLRESLGL